jgi:CRP-like cAMP-binding protein
MFEDIINTIKKDDRRWVQFQGFISQRQIPARTILLHEGEISTHAHYIKKGCLREWFNKDGKEITFQFFFEGQAVASIDSFLNNQPSLYTIESIEPSIIYSISKDKFEEIFQLFPEFKGRFQELMYQRFRNYANLFLSRIKDSPRERYEDLIRNHPEIIKRIPQHYIASYLGITPVSLSRIRNKK